MFDVYYFWRASKLQKILHSSNPGLCLVLVILAVAIMESGSQDKTRKDTTTEACKAITARC